MDVPLSDEILCRLKVALEASTNVDRQVPRSLASPIPLSPWCAWLLLSLTRHRERQQFVLQSMKFRLGGDPEVLAHLGGLGHPDCPTSGLVPHDSQWEYRFHGRGCAMTNRVTGECIDVDFFDETADWISPYFYVNYLESLAQPRFIEARLLELYPTAETVELGLEELHELGLLVQHEEERAVKLAFDWRPYCELLEEFERRWDAESVRTLVAAALSDWFLLAGEKDRAEQCSIARRRRLLEYCACADLAAIALQALADFDYPEFDGELRRALAGAADRRMSRAVEIIREKQLSALYADILVELLIKFDPNAGLPAPFIWTTVAELLLKVKAELKSNLNLQNFLLAIQSSGLGDAAILAMEFHLPCAMVLIRRALRSAIPYNRIQIASALAIIDLPWCHAELKAVLDETTDQEATTECRSALLESRNADAHQWVDEWEQRNPYLPPEEEYRTVGEWAKLRNDAVIRYEMQTLHDRIYPLRQRFEAGSPQS